VIAARAALLVLAACGGCDCFAPAWVVEGEVLVPAPGPPLVVQVIVDDGPARVALATLAREPRYELRWRQFGEGRRATVTAWVDLDGSSMLEALLARRSFTDVDELETPDDPDLVVLRAARPSTGDPIAIAELELATRESRCDSGSATIVLAPEPP
jgi:hypothetical protein